MSEVFSALVRNSLFDVMGPVMVGPSSSHTAGAARIGKCAYETIGERIDEVRFGLHGSFAKTYRGHGTDRALVAGILGMEPGDRRLKHALTIAKERGISYTFCEENLGDVHPNTVAVYMTGVSGRRFCVTGSSVGGGSIEILSVIADSFNGRSEVVQV